MTNFRDVIEGLLAAAGIALIAGFILGLALKVAMFIFNL